MGNLVADPNPVIIEEAGQEGSFLARWTGLAADEKYLGVLHYEGSTRPTLVSVDTAAPAGS